MSEDAYVSGTPAVTVAQLTEAFQIVNDQAAGLNAEDLVPFQPAQRAVDAFPGGTDKVGQILVGQSQRDQDALIRLLAAGVAESDQGGGECSGFAVCQKVAYFGFQYPLVDGEPLDEAEGQVGVTEQYALQVLLVNDAEKRIG